MASAMRAATLAATHPCMASAADPLLRSAEGQRLPWPLRRGFAAGRIGRGRVVRAAGSGGQPRTLCRLGTCKTTRGGFVAQFSACEDGESAADTESLSGTHTGVATFLFIQACELICGRCNTLEERRQKLTCAPANTRQMPTTQPLGTCMDRHGGSTGADQLLPGSAAVVVRG